MFSQNQYHSHPDQSSTNYSGHQQLAHSNFDPFSPVASNTHSISNQGPASYNNNYNNPSGSPKRPQGGFPNPSDFSQGGGGSLSLPVVPAAASDPFAPVPSRPPPAPAQGSQFRDSFAPPTQVPRSQTLNNPTQQGHSGLQQSTPPPSHDPFARRTSMSPSHDSFAQPQQSHVNHDPFAAQLNMGAPQGHSAANTHQQQSFHSAQQQQQAQFNPFAMPQSENQFGTSTSGPAASENPFMAQAPEYSPAENPFMSAQQDQSQGYNPFR